MLVIEDLHAFYGQSHVLQGVSLAVPAGGAVSLLGRNGVGKTTTLRSIMGLVRARGGTVRFEARDLLPLRPHQIARLGIGYVQEDRGILPGLTVRETLDLGLAALGAVSPALRAERFERVYAYFPILAERARQLATTLSGGEQQMLALGRALMGNARLLLLDEPTEGLAPVVVKQLARILSTLRHKEGIALLLVEQNARVALELSDRVCVMQRGRISLDVAATEVESADALRSRLGV